MNSHYLWALFHKPPSLLHPLHLRVVTLLLLYIFTTTFFYNHNPTHLLFALVSQPLVQALVYLSLLTYVCIPSPVPGELLRNSPLKRVPADLRSVRSRAGWNYVSMRRDVSRVRDLRTRKDRRSIWPTTHTGSHYSTLKQVISPLILKEIGKNLQFLSTKWNSLFYAISAKNGEKRA